MLQVARRNVVGQRDAAQSRAPIFFLEIACAAANDQRQLAFIIHAGRGGGHAHHATGFEQRRRRLQKKQRLRGQFVAQLFHVIAIVAAHADNFRGRDRR